MLRAGLVEVRWQVCTGLNSSPACDVPPGPSELLLIVREGTPCQDTSATLGEAWVVRRAGGVLATVYVNCVAWLATAARTDVAVLLGRVAAHELGHLVMRTSAHARRGLMRPNWTPLYRPISKQFPTCQCRRILASSAISPSERQCRGYTGKSP